MIRIGRFALAILYGLAFAGTGRADHFTIDLEVKGPKAGRTVHAEKAGPADFGALGARPKPRETLEVQAGDRITIKWKIASTAPKETVKDVLVHFFVVKIDKPGDPPPPRPLFDKDAILQSALTMDFKPKDKSEGEWNLQVDKAGVYLLRLETLKTKRDRADADEHEYFANLDVVAR